MDIYTRNKNGRYQKLGMIKPWLPNGVHLVHVEENESGRSTFSHFNVKLCDIHKLAKVTMSRKTATDIVMRAMEGRPTQKLTATEWEQWEEFKKTPLGKKIAYGVTISSANEVARNILKGMVGLEQDSETL
jgi:hypothetical protein